MFSVVILTLNEERNLPACLACLPGVDDVHVLDSGSTDRTASLARAAGAHVSVHPFASFADQRNHAHARLPLRHSWVFHLDADERMRPELLAELRAFVAAQPTDPAAPGAQDGAYAAPRMLWQGRWLPRCTDYPAWQARLCRVATFRFVEHGHGQREQPGQRLAYLKNPYDHEMAADGEAAWLEKHRRYARREAASALADAPPPAGQVLRALLGGDALARRRALKQCAAHLPARAAVRFVYQYGLRGGFLDGGPAWRYCRLLARYEGWIAAERRALRSAPPPAPLS
jgi:glycosyltransferase involved in cell wall biosynthesis